MRNPSSGDLVQMPCVVCTGAGATTCGSCGGAGATFLSKSRLRYDRSLEFYQERQPCRICFGTGRTSCLSCKGVGWTLQHRNAGSNPTRPPRRAAPEPPAARQPSEPFAFTPFEFARHPADGKLWACWQDDPGNCLDYGDDGGRIFLSGCPRDTWLYIQRASGNVFPLEIYVSSDAGLAGRWV